MFLSVIAASCAALSSVEIIGPLFGFVILVGAGGMIVWGLKAIAPNLFAVGEPRPDDAELRLGYLLRKVLGDEWAIFAKVRMSDIMTVPRGVAGWQTQFNKVQSKHVDFAVCDPSTLRVVAAIELDDSSHKRLDRKERDAFVEKVFATAKLPLIRVPAKQAYTIDVLRNLLAGQLPREKGSTREEHEVEESMGDERFAGYVDPIKTQR